MEQILDYLVDIIALLVIVGILVLIHMLFKVLLITPRLNKIKRLLQEKDYFQAKTLLLDSMQKQPKRKEFIDLKKQFDQSMLNETPMKPLQISSAGNIYPVKQNANYNFMCAQYVQRNRFWVGTNVACLVLFIYQCLSYTILIPEFAFPAAWWVMTMLFSVGFILYSIGIIRNIQTFPNNYFLYQGIFGLFFSVEYITLYFLSAHIYSGLNMMIRIIPILPEIVLLYGVYRRRIIKFKEEYPWNNRSHSYRIIFLIVVVIMSFIAPLLKSLNAAQILPWAFLLSGYIFSLSFLYIVDYRMIQKDSLR